MVSNSDLSLYIHIPFCKYKCPYCHFYVLLEKEELKDLLLEALLLELQSYKSQLQDRKIVSVYFGGGTPILFGEKRLQTVLEAIHTHPDCEITIEANPENVTPELMQGLFSIGINRVSIGVQSFQDSELMQLGRKHAASLATKAIFTTYEAGFRNISIDLMYDVPKQSLESLHHTLAHVKTLPITHLSLYNLTIEPYTPFHRKEKELRALMPDDETSTQMYEIAIAELGAMGLQQYEISAFCRDGLLSRHNTGYWTGRQFIGFGPSAFSFFGDKRFRNVANLVDYAKKVKNGLSPVDFVEEISLIKRKRELLTLQLRLLKGIDLSTLGPLDDETEKSIELLINQGFIEKNSHQLSLTKRGIFFYDHVASELI